MYQKLKRWFSNPVGIASLLAAFAILLVCGRRCYVLRQTPAHLTEISRAHGYLGLIYGEPRPNPDGNRIAFSQMSEDGIGVFLLDLTSGKRTLIHEKMSTDDWFRTVDVWPWSPGGEYFAYSHTNLIVCDAGGKELGQLPVEGFNGVASLTWLDDHSFVYVSKAGNLHQIRMDRPDHWIVADNRRIRAGAEQLTTLSPDIVCWQKANCIWSFNLKSNLANVLFYGGTNRIEDFTYSPETSEFLVTCAGTGANRILRIGFNGNDCIILEPLQASAIAHRAESLNGKNGIFAYICHAPEQPENSYLEILTSKAKTPVKLFEQGKVDAMAASLNGRKLFVVGAISNEPASSIWEYDADSGKLDCVVAGQDYPSSYASRVPSRQMAINLGGRKFNYHVFEPPGLNPDAHHKYPLIIGDTLFKTLDPAYQNRVHGPYWAPMLANAGAFVVIVERPGAWLNEIDRWQEYVRWIHEKMLRNPTIDPDRVYLFATSAETAYLARLVDEDPKPWKGLILLNPGQMPNLEALSKAEFPPKILISQGALEGTNRVQKYQLAGMKRGVRVEYYTHEGSAHILLGKKVLGERAEAMAKFVFED